MYTYNEKIGLQHMKIGSENRMESSNTVYKIRPEKNENNGH